MASLQSADAWGSLLNLATAKHNGNLSRDASHATSILQHLRRTPRLCEVLIRNSLRSMDLRCVVTVAEEAARWEPTGAVLNTIKDILHFSNLAIRALAKQTLSNNNNHGAVEDGADALQGHLHASYASVVELVRWLGKYCSSTSLGEPEKKLCQEIALLAATCLKGAPPLLVAEASVLIEAMGFQDVNTSAKLLVAMGHAANVSTLLCNEHFQRATAVPLQKIVRAVAAKQANMSIVEEGLLSGCRALVCMQLYNEVVRAHKDCPTLRSSDSLVSAFVGLGDVESAIDTLEEIIESKDNWNVFPVPLVTAIHELAVAVGNMGSAQTVLRFATVMSHFNSYTFYSGRFLEGVVAGIGDRVSRLSRNNADLDSGKGSLSKLVHPIVSILRCTTDLLGRDFSVDTALRLLDCCLKQQHLAVPLVHAVVNVLEGSASVALRFPDDPLFFKRYALEAAGAERTLSTENLDHLKVAWASDISRLTSTLPSEEHRWWQCKKCSKFSGARYAYCSCSALRFGFVACTNCSFVQDERHKNCQVCCTPIDTCARDQSIKVSNWRCRDCGTNNLAFNLFKCYRCHSLTGPLMTNVRNSGGACAACKATNKRGPSLQPYCSDCGERTADFVNTANHVLWFCHHCVAYHAVTDSCCPERGSAELTSMTIRKAWIKDCESCPNCHRVVESPFEAKCRECHANLLGTARGGGKVAHHERWEIELQATALICPACCAVNEGRCAQEACCHCGGTLCDAEFTTVNARRRCKDCGILPTAKGSRLSLVCSHCAGPVTTDIQKEASWAHILHSLEDVMVHTSSSSPLSIHISPVEKLVEMLELLSEISERLDDPPPGFERQAVTPVAFCRARLREALLTDATAGMARRGLTLCDRLWRVRSDELPATTCATTADQCRECGGSHPSSCCYFNKTPWQCSSCKTEHTNRDGLSRYLCRSCLQLKEEVMDKSPSEAWLCGTCHKANVEFEDRCIYCGCCAGKSNSTIPFFPARCGNCGNIHLEATCAECDSSAQSNMRDMEGTVCLVHSRFAFIQPKGTSSPKQRIYVSEQLLKEMQLTQGQPVLFQATLGDRGNMKATHLSTTTN